MSIGLIIKNKIVSEVLCRSTYETTINNNLSSIRIQRVSKPLESGIGVMDVNQIHR